MRFAGYVFVLALCLEIGAQGQVLKVLGRKIPVQAERPNIVFMLCDDMRYDRIAALNSWDTDLQTPHLDQLVTDGMNFTRAYDTTPICSASRGQVFTGLYEFSTGCNFNRENEKKITILIEGTAKKGYDANWLKNTVTLPLVEADIKQWEED